MVNHIFLKAPPCVQILSSRAARFSVSQSTFSSSLQCLLNKCLTLACNRLTNRATGPNSYPGCRCWHSQITDRISWLQMLLLLAAAGVSVRRTACLESITCHRRTREQSTCLSPKAQASKRHGKAQVKKQREGASFSRRRDGDNHRSAGSCRERALTLFGDGPTPSRRLLS